MGCANSKSSSAPAAGAAEQSTVLSAPDAPKVEATETPTAATNEEDTPEAENTKVKVVISEIRGLSVISPICSVEIVGKPASKQSTGKAENKEHEVSWDSTQYVQGVAEGNSLIFMVWDAEGKTKLGEASLTSDQTRAGFVGELQLTGTAAGLEAFLKVNVDGLAPTPTEAISHVAEQAQEAVTEAISDAVALVDNVKEEAAKIAAKLREDMTDVVHDATEVVQTEDKGVMCVC